MGEQVIGKFAQLLKVGPNFNIAADVECPICHTANNVVLQWTPDKQRITMPATDPAPGEAGADADADSTDSATDVVEVDVTTMRRICIECLFERAVPDEDTRHSATLISQSVVRQEQVLESGEIKDVSKPLPPSMRAANGNFVARQTLPPAVLQRLQPISTQSKPKAKVGLANVQIDNLDRSTKKEVDDRKIVGGELPQGVQYARQFQHQQYDPSQVQQMTQYSYANQQYSQSGVDPRQFQQQQINRMGAPPMQQPPPMQYQPPPPQYYPQQQQQPTMYAYGRGRNPYQYQQGGRY